MINLKFLHNKSYRIVFTATLSLILVVIAVATYVASQGDNGMQSESNETTTQEMKPGNKLRETELYSFQYAGGAWNSTQNYLDGKLKYSSQIRSANFKSEGKDMNGVVTKGAEVTLLVELSEKTLDEVRSNTFDTLKAYSSQPENVENVMIGGVSAVTYEIDGVKNRSYATLFVAGEYTYVVTYQVAEGEKPAVYKSGYDELLSTFKFK